MKVYSVKFKNQGKNYFFNGSDDYQVNDYVIVLTERGLQYGKISGLVNDEASEEKYKSIVRLATEEDNSEYLKLVNEATEALEKCKNLVTKLDIFQFQFLF